MADESKTIEVVIAGFGVPGRVVADALAQRGVHFCVIELNAATVVRCGKSHVPIIEGDCADPEVLIRAGIKEAHTFVIVIPNDKAAIAATTHARKLNPTMRILTRCHYTSAGIEAKARGADEVIVAEQVATHAPGMFVVIV